MRLGNPIYSDEVMPDRGPRDVDKMMAAAQRWEQMWSALLDEHGARYEILYGVKNPGDSEWCDPEKCSTTHLDASFGARIDACGVPDTVDLAVEGDRFLEESGLGEFLFYDGWESGDCNSNDPHQWPKNFWYEHHRPDRLHTTGAFEDVGYEVRELKRKLLR